MPPFPMPFYNGQIQQEQPHATPLAEVAQSYTPQTTQFSLPDNPVSTAPPASMPGSGGMSSAPAANPLDLLKMFALNSAPTGTPGTDGSTSSPRVSVPGIGASLPNASNYAIDDRLQLPGAPAGWKSPFLHGGPSMDKKGYQSAINQYLTHRQRQLDHVLASADPATRAATQYQVDSAIQALEDGTTKVDGKSYDQMSQEDKLKAKDAIFQSAVDQNVQPYLAAATGQSASQGQFTPEKAALLSILLTAVMKPYADQSRQTSLLAASAANDLADQAPNATLRLLGKSQAANAANIGNTVANAYTQQALIQPMIAAYQSAGQAQNQNQALQNQLLQQYAANAQQSSSGSNSLTDAINPPGS